MASAAPLEGASEYTTVSTAAIPTSARDRDDIEKFVSCSMFVLRQVRQSP
jgi:hypothetical protein